MSFYGLWHEDINRNEELGKSRFGEENKFNLEHSEFVLPRI